MTTMSAIAKRMATDLITTYAADLANSTQWPLIPGDPFKTVHNIQSLAFQGRDDRLRLAWFQAMICRMLDQALLPSIVFFVERPDEIIGKLVNWLLSYHRFHLRIKPGVVGSYDIYVSLE